jgi:hypothetical protein
LENQRAINVVAAAYARRAAAEAAEAAEAVNEQDVKAFASRAIAKAVA